MIAVLSRLSAAEHPAVMGGRVGACLFSSLAFPAGLWGLGAVEIPTAAVIAAAATLIATRPIMTSGGLRIASVLALQFVVALVACTATLPLLPAVILAAFFPLVGMLAFVTVAAKVATVVFARDNPVQEADVVIARATQANVVDIRSAGASRRTGPKARGPASDAATESHQHAG
jgi:hypothetical protein